MGLDNARSEATISCRICEKQTLTYVVLLDICVLFAAISLYALQMLFVHGILASLVVTVMTLQLRGDFLSLIQLPDLDLALRRGTIECGLCTWSFPDTSSAALDCLASSFAWILDVGERRTNFRDEFLLVRESRSCASSSSSFSRGRLHEVVLAHGVEAVPGWLSVE